MPKNNKETTDLLLTFATQALESYADSLNLNLKKKEDREKIQKDLIQAIESYLEVNS
jgi:hypothetical protein